ncbi:MAG: hypothetical protein AAFO07_25420 [Bacteroidota bacterium]
MYNLKLSYTVYKIKMINRFFLTTTLLFISNYSFSQTRQLECKTIFLDSIGGVIFLPGCEIPYAGTSNRIALTRKQVLEAKRELSIQINQVLASDPRIQDGFQIKNPTRYFKKFKRQYFGYIEESTDDKIIGINFLNFNRKRKRKVFASWKAEFIIGFGEFFEKNTRILDYNLTTHKLKIP